MRPLILKGKLNVMSIHNFFPLPDDIPLSKANGDRFLLSTPEKGERELAVRMTTRTFECAEDLGAAALVLHLGKVDMEPENERLYDLFSQQRLGSPEGHLFLEGKLKELSSRQSEGLLETHALSQALEERGEALEERPAEK